MMSLIQRRTNEVGHTGIDNGEFLGCAFLHIKHTRNQRAALPHNRPSRLEMQFLVGRKLQIVAEHSKIVFEVGNRIAVRIVVVNSETATHIHYCDFSPKSLHAVKNFTHLPAQQHERSSLRDLRAYMEMHTTKVNIVERQRRFDKLVKILKIDAEFVFAQPRCDILVCMGVHVGIDAHCNVRHHVLASGNLVDVEQFRQRLDVETMNVGVKCQRNLAVGLAHPGKHYVAAGESGIQSRHYLATAHAVHTQSSLAHRCEDTRIGISLDSIVHLTSAGLLLHLVESQPEQLHVIVIERSLYVFKFINRKCSHNTILLSVEQFLTQFSECLHLVILADKE